VRTDRDFRRSGDLGALSASDSVTHPAYGVLRPVTESASVMLCDNPGLMTLDGTNTWVLRAPGSDDMVIVDPGPEDAEHIGRLAALGRIPLILISHRHADHTGGIDALVDVTGATVRSVGSGFLRGYGEVIEAAGLRIRVLATPGHTADSVSFVLDDAVLTADTVLGRGTTVIDDEDGSLADYLDSLHRLRGLGRRTVLPGHGPELGDLAAVAERYLAHRHERLDQVREALRVLGDDATARQVVEQVYRDVDETLWGAAESSVRAQISTLLPSSRIQPRCAKSARALLTVSLEAPTS
jgi:glyoxylase-like metal-dependent hydrolase (beta-lactamase superfamily II)